MTGTEEEQVVAAVEPQEAQPQEEDVSAVKRKREDEEGGNEEDPVVKKQVPDSTEEPVEEVAGVKGEEAVKGEEEGAAASANGNGSQEVVKGEDEKPAVKAATILNDANGDDPRKPFQGVFEAAESGANAAYQAAAAAAVAKGGGSNLLDKLVDPDAVEELIEVPQNLVGRIIGRGGDTIRDLQARTSTKMQIDQNFPDGVARRLTISGSAPNVKIAKDMVTTVMEEGPQALQQFAGQVVPGAPSTTTHTVDCPKELVGRIIGKGGETIGELQARSRARVHIDQNVPEGTPRKIVITGDSAAVLLATQMVQVIMENGPGAMAAVQHQATFGNNSEAPYTVECPKHLVGRVIGRGGETIQMLQAKTGARIQIDQNVGDAAPCKITVSGGPPGAVALGAQMVYDVMTNGPQQLMNMPPFVPGPPQYGGGGGHHHHHAGGGGGGGGHYGSVMPAAYGQPVQHVGYGAPAPVQQQQPPLHHHYAAAPVPAPAPAPYASYNAAPAPQQQQQQAYDPYRTQAGGGGYSAPQQQAVAAPSYGGAQQASYGAPAVQAAPYGASSSQPSYGSAAPAASSAGGYHQYQQAAPAAQSAPSAQPPAPTPVAPGSEWVECKTPEGNVYYYNTRSQVSQWHKP